MWEFYEVHWQVRISHTILESCLPLYIYPLLEKNILYLKRMYLYKTHTHYLLIFSEILVVFSVNHR